MTGREQNSHNGEQNLWQFGNKSVTVFWNLCHRFFPAGRRCFSSTSRPIAFHFYSTFAANPEEKWKKSNFFSKNIRIRVVFWIARGLLIVRAQENVLKWFSSGIHNGCLPRFREKSKRNKLFSWKQANSCRFLNRTSFINSEREIRKTPVSRNGCFSKFPRRIDIFSIYNNMENIDSSHWK